MNNTEKEIISLLTEDSRITAKQIAAALGITEKAAAQTVRSLEERGVIVKYTAIVNADSVDEDFVEALIEVKVTPQRGLFVETPVIASNDPSLPRYGTS